MLLGLCDLEMTLLDEIRSKCSAELLASRDVAAITEAVNLGRTKPNTREIGNGTILETLGLDTGNALLDVINSVAAFRHVKPLVEQGRLMIGSPLVQATVQSLVPSVLTQPQADSLCALGMGPNPVSLDEVIRVCYDGNGKEWIA